MLSSRKTREQAGPLNCAIPCWICSDNRRLLALQPLLTVRRCGKSQHLGFPSGICTASGCLDSSRHNVDYLAAEEEASSEIRYGCYLPTVKYSNQQRTCHYRHSMKLIHYADITRQQGNAQSKACSRFSEGCRLRNPLKEFARGSYGVPWDHLHRLLGRGQNFFWDPAFIGALVISSTGWAPSSNKLYKCTPAVASVA